MGQNQPITLGAAAVMALLAAPVLAQTPTPPATGSGGLPSQPLASKGPPAVMAPGPAPATTLSQPAVGPIKGLLAPAPPARSAPAGLAPQVSVEPLILWQPEGSTTPRSASAKPPSSPLAPRPGGPPGGAGRPAGGPNRPNGLVDPFAPMGPGAGINPFLPGMAPQGPGASGMDPRRMGGRRIPAGGGPGAGPQQRLRQGPNGMPMPPGPGSLGGSQSPMPGGMMSPPGAVPPGMVPPGAGPAEMMPPGATPPGGVPPGVQAPNASSLRSPAAGAISSAKWSPWPSLLATLGLVGAGVLLAFLARRRFASGSPDRLPIGAEGGKNGSSGRIETREKTD